MGFNPKLLWSVSVDAAFTLTLSTNGPLRLLLVYFMPVFAINKNLPSGGLVTSLALSYFKTKLKENSWFMCGNHLKPHK